MTASTIVFIVLAAVFACITAFWFYKVHSKKTPRYLWFFAGLRFLTVFCVLLLLINPKYSKQDLYLVKPELVIAVDNSTSISFFEEKETSIALRNHLKEHAALNEQFNLNFLTFGQRLESGVNNAFNEEQTLIDNALNTIKATYRDRVAPIVLISDGNQTFGADYSFRTQPPGQPVYPVVLGDTAMVRDLSVSRINVNRYAYLGNEFPVEVFLNYSGQEPVETTFTISRDNDVLFQRTLRFDEENNSTVLTTNLKASVTGTAVYQASLSSLPQEKNTGNNLKNFAIEVIDEKTEVLIISDISHPDIGMLRRSIESNERRKVTLKNSRLPVNQLNGYQLVILYQPGPAFRSVYEFLQKNNTSFFVITGTKTDWNFLNTIQDDYKKEWFRQTENIQASVNSQYNVFSFEDLGFEDYPPLHDDLGEIRINVPAEVLFFQKIRNVNLKTPLLFTYEKDNSRYGVLLGENIWKWRAQRYVDASSFEDFDRFLGKLVFYLASNTRKQRLAVSYEPFYDENTAFRLTAEFFNRNYEFDDTATLDLVLTNIQDSTTRTLPMLLKSGYYEADLNGLPAGDYSFTVQAGNENISRSGSFKVLDFNIERQFLRADITRLGTLAKTSGGQMFFPDEWERLVDTLMNDPANKAIQKSKVEKVSLIDFRFLLFLVVLLLSLEWLSRKYSGYV
ncbi:VWA domain-containing protein [Ascidiimonas aurantiaca]|uniref:VWA domain-containing protein n=1 Tax=Ascidiimonas aurantiaca TaxID=1685432 RepID=UPI0030EE77BD